ncbi:MAG: CoA-binding protein [Flavobacteriaceae bacterium]|nr:CoA-binding protein [Flavobacteriaceae bacterium]MCY4267232.1 CoA-binding protein [Flavobacteriaceae bacterium]MCY4299268.1 CoA-binding protein [Flavobacteriaceae bacterium]
MNTRKTTLILGASTNPERYAYKAAKSLMSHGYEIFLVGNKQGSISSVSISNKFPKNKKIHTVTLYLSAKNQENYYTQILRCKPKRVIFNPGTENETLEKRLDKHQINHERSCTLILLSTGQYDI